jgi:hypothetical protein
VSIFLDYGDQLVDQPKKVLAAPLRYAKTAKRVDVKRLKENIWKEMLDLTDQVWRFNFNKISLAICQVKQHLKILRNLLIWSMD